MTAAEVQELVKGERNVPLIIDFYATWCGPCILMAQELEMVCLITLNFCMNSHLNGNASVSCMYGSISFSLGFWILWW